MITLGCLDELREPLPDDAAVSCEAVYKLLIPYRSLEPLWLSRRAESSLQRNGLHRLGDLIELDAKQWVNLRGMGMKTRTEIYYALISKWNMKLPALVHSLDPANARNLYRHPYTLTPFQGGHNHVERN
jgi:DNA-directed RNA polymerase alpha subunit